MAQLLNTTVDGTLTVTQEIYIDDDELETLYNTLASI